MKEMEVKINYRRWKAID